MAEENQTELLEQRYEMISVGQDEIKQQMSELLKVDARTRQSRLP